MCSKTPSNLKGKVNISLVERKMEDIERDLGEPESDEKDDNN